MVEEPVSPPQEHDIHVVTLVHDFDAPELLRHELLNSEVTVHYEAKCRELTRSYRGIREYDDPRHPSIQ